MENSVLPAASYRLVMLRKFCVAPGDEVHVERVLNAMTECLEPPGGSDTVDAFRCDFRQLAQLIAVDEGEASPTSFQDVVRDWLYGGVLHGDYDKCARTLLRVNLTLGLALWFFVLEAEGLVRRMCRAAKLGIAEGVLRDR